MYGNKKIYWTSVTLACSVVLLIILLSGAIGGDTAQAATVEHDGSLSQYSDLFQGSQDEPPSMDHSLFPVLAGEFTSGQQVTQACLSCHPNAALEIMQTTHWTWTYTHPKTGQELGKKNIINNTSLGVDSNGKVCSSCHAGYGWEDDSFDFNAQQNVDCLVCHDTTGTYAKMRFGAGNPVSEDAELKGPNEIPVDLVFVAQNVGPTSRASCGNCHFNGGGQDPIKHGNIDPTLANPDSSLDVHMGVDSSDFNCTDCHWTDGHKVSGSRFAMNSTDEDTCETCHGAEPHLYRLLNSHLDRVSCQACHITAIGRGSPVLISWDWSKAGKTADDGNLIIEKDGDGNVIYDTRLGSLQYVHEATPVYIWFNGSYDYTLVSDTIDLSSSNLVMNAPQGSIDDPNSRIWPMILRNGVLPYDTKNSTFAIPKLCGDNSNCFFSTLDWSLALSAGMQVAGLPFSGNYDFVSVDMYWPITHTIAPADASLRCEDCHSTSGRLDLVALGYSPQEIQRLSQFPSALEGEINPAEHNTPDYCSNCHNDTYGYWSESLHSQNSVGCISCHEKQGEEEHPIAPFSADNSSNVCGACHLAEHSDWELSDHAEMNIGCAGCHEPHTQAQKLVDDNKTACENCHLDETEMSVHSSHFARSVTCVDCHKNSSTDTGHNFDIYTGACLACHGEDIHGTTSISDSPTEDEIDLPQAEEATNSMLEQVPAWSLGVIGLVIGAAASWFSAGRFFNGKNGNSSDSTDN
jgi:octaheme c-type cytochrome (tetrathionate reductase family)